jgi:hypothetical protein
VSRSEAGASASRMQRRRVRAVPVRLEDDPSPIMWN